MFIPVWVTGTISTKKHLRTTSGTPVTTIAATKIEKYRLPGN